MATIKINGQTSPSNMLCLSDSYNILEYSGSVSGTNAEVRLNISSLTSGSPDYYLTILDETITSTEEVTNATNKRFYVGDNASTAYYIARALRCCDSLNADWNIYNQNTQVILKAKTIGKKIAAADITNNMNITPAITAGTSSALYGGMVNLRITADTGTVELQKNVVDNYTSFNISPTIASFAEPGKIKPFTTRLSTVDNTGAYNELMSGTTNYVTYGYVANNSEPYLAMTPKILANMLNGSDIITYYTYTNVVPFTILYNTGNTSYTWEMYNSRMSRIQSGTTNITGGVDKQMMDLQLTLPNNYFTSTFHVYITYGQNTLMMDVIKPLTMADSHIRAYWRNEYGGISYFDFTGARSEANNISMETYNKNFYDYYRTSDRAEKIPYSNGNEKEVTVKSHLMTKNARYIAESLINSKIVWLQRASSKDYILHKGIEVTEVDQNKGLFEITYTYTYSI